MTVCAFSKNTFLGATIFRTVFFWVATFYGYSTFG